MCKATVKQKQVFMHTFVNVMPTLPEVCILINNILHISLQMSRLCKQHHYSLCASPTKGMIVVLVLCN